ncbi:MAG: T9SS type A sorting domain-containing protein [Saprospiraceae bacterium]|nr:T9SS type A sorting domain-containing protein [Saprospiraceae bacterium]
MKRLLSVLLTTSLLAIILVLAYQCSPTHSRKAQSIKDAFENNYKRIKDPALGYPPMERMLVALEQTRRKQAEWAARTGRGPLADVRWRERGPNNIGGRTRTILVDKKDPSRHTVWAGSVAGGLWKTTDVTADPAQWQKVSDYLENMAIGALAQDPNNPDIMYLGTGEAYGNLDAVAGMGLFKSTDNGVTWSPIEATLTSNFRYTQDIVVHPQTGHVYAGTSTGVYRTTNDGETWQRVLSGFCYDLYYMPDGNLYASNTSNIYRSQTGNNNQWTRITAAGSGFATDGDRTEFTVSHSNPNFIYAILSNNGAATSVYFTPNGGQTWVQRSQPRWDNGNEFTNGQAWYDLDIAVDPFNANHVIAGGVPTMRSTDGGFSWQRFGNSMHVDQHFILFDELVQNTVYFGNDGGIYYSPTGSNGQPIDKNFGYNVTQFYACAIHPEAYSTYYLGGTQDNNSLQLNNYGVTTARSVWGGDGFYAHIDENEPHIQLVSSQFGNWGISTDGGQDFDNAAGVEGDFINPSDYDSEANILYTETDNGDFYRWRVNDRSGEVVDIENVTNDVSAVTVDPNDPQRVYFGNYNGRIVRVDEAREGATVTGAALPTLSGVISSIDIELGNPNHLLVTVSNYGVSSVYESNNGGQSWISLEGDLPDMPVRWGIFNPNDATQAMIATEAGVWTTELINGNNTEWIPPVPGRGTPLVSTHMLRLRRSDGVVLAATHGRGLYTTDVFATPTPRIGVEPIQYTDSANPFYGEASLNADSYFWEFGDGATSTAENPEYAYATSGAYSVKLTINGDLSTTAAVKVLPTVPLPYVTGQANYGGDMEGFNDHFGAYSPKGSAFERGNSSIIGKNGTHSGDNAYVLGLNDNYYAPNTEAYLYTPNYDLTDPGIYEFSFWAKYNIHPGYDGFLVQYSLDKGKNWAVLGTDDSPNWYNYHNVNTGGLAFPGGSSYFTSSVNGFTRYKINVSGLAGNEAAFRFVFRSEGTGNFPGVAIDDVALTKYDGELATVLTGFTGEWTGATQIGLNWTTLPEYYCRKFEVARSTNGIDFEVIGTVNAKGGTTAYEQIYDYSAVGTLNLYFFRLQVINIRESTNYDYSFFSPIIAVRRNLEGLEVQRLFPNPFQEDITVTLTDVVSRDLPYVLYNTKGQLVYQGSVTVDASPLAQFNLPGLPGGAYFLQIDLGDGNKEVFKVLRN